MPAGAARPAAWINPRGGLNRGFLQNMARFLQVAKDNGIYAILTMDALPDSNQYQGLLNPYRGQFEGFNLEFMTQGGVDAQAKYQTDLIRGLMEVGAPMDAILAYQIKEEAYFEENLPPLNAASGEVTPANGQTYSLADPAQRRALMEDSWLYYIDQVTTRHQGRRSHRAGDDGFLRAAGTQSGARRRSALRVHGQGAE